MSEATNKDGILESFVEATNENGFALDISLLVNGSIVSGTLVSAEDYYKSLSESFKDGNDVAKEFSEQFSDASESAKSSEGGANFIHLKDARVYLNGSHPIPSVGSTLWRGRLTEVDSFFLGKITEAK
ncbi:gas vesicle protein GvpU [Staphylococcus agnetis]|uniref:Gas vesicle protein GvpU n=3 Tax=Staphylococcus TaxID=1279 RepID=A0A2T4ME62_9STAP|nr:MULTISPECIES: gas vesicle accessory protein GvpU [Staphylococcus]ALN77642.1 gas vesicle protein GvpU [Staphylococcus agnetis]MCO4325483.1 gas vesicle protein GvpU [Staphylococcus agnetis]MCO4337562.1 gas vesicle protein GvpU [Staphylococcus agnetis]MCO4339870.1 gas vesicle protein GvpU [Staphylococcus agnetis]MCO4342364.1 gas vesicle protein GvpU [Staphylococcus agnetis]